MGTVDDIYTVRADQTLTVAAPGVLANDITPPGVALTVVKVTDPASGTLTLGSDGGFTYVPVSVGTVTFTYKANDGSLDSEIATVTIDVTPGNSPPVAADDLYDVTHAPALTVAAPGVLANDKDPKTASLTAVLVSDVSADEGVMVLGEDGLVIYDPGSFIGTTSFTY